MREGDGNRGGGGGNSPIDLQNVPAVYMSWSGISITHCGGTLISVGDVNLDVGRGHTRAFENLTDLYITRTGYLHASLSSDSVTFDI